MRRRSVHIMGLICIELDDLILQKKGYEVKDAG